MRTRWGECSPALNLRPKVEMFIQGAQPPTAYQEANDEDTAEERRNGELRGAGDRGPEGESHYTAVEETGGGRCVLPPIPQNENQGRGENAGEEPTRVVAQGNPVVESALRPDPETQAGGARIQDAVNGDEQLRRHQNPENASQRSSVSGRPRGGDRPQHERSPGEGERLGHHPRDLRPQGVVAVVEIPVGEAGGNAGCLYGEAQGGERGKAQYCAPGADEPPEGDEGGQRYE